MTVRHLRTCPLKKRRKKKHGPSNAKIMHIFVKMERPRQSWLGEIIRRNSVYCELISLSNRTVPGYCVMRITRRYIHTCHEPFGLSLSRQLFSVTKGLVMSPLIGGSSTSFLLLPHGLVFPFVLSSHPSWHYQGLGLSSFDHHRIWVYPATTA